MRKHLFRQPRAAVGLALLAATGAALAQSAAPASAPASAAPAAPTQADTALMAGTCVNCHGAPGHPSPGLMPLNGLPAALLRERMLAFRADQVPGATVMPRLMRGYTETQIDALAQWLGQGVRP